ncbi:ParB/RepB/Spo0J family partition protein [Sinorhizobium meliloti]|uniref:ParB/RepB/Spo0J family partition protein n=1 Tax=Rhizobium meliloti TaxID=382 RepID=UPI000FD76F03|nr:ParB/RepB/Spo0J family partition protein [Sinorhizobium meliloti]RVK90346.1 ParB/RepB/Spo0J family partition protein [Sinorhizobium meliloti]RVN44854.1 ParB/RepB/Spo0J family partition protein [Sinorhizobium meliloti]
MPETAVEAISAEAVTVETEAAGPATSLIPDTRQIPLSKLTASKKNVRKKSAAMTIPELASSIEAHGLIQNLTVRKAAKGNKYEVIAGSRRFAALTLLAKQGRIDKSALVPCNVRSGDDNDTEISLAENTQREAMSLVEEILGYRQLVKDGMTPETIAARFGQSIVTVRQRLKLAHLSPRILDELSEDAISLDQAKALAISDDHAAQESAWFDTPSWNRAPYSLRAMLTRDHVRSTDKLTLFVGTEAYEDAGGEMARDLFADASTTFLTDPALLVRLATEKLEDAPEPLKIKGWKWVETSLEASGIHSGGFGRIHPVSRVPTEAEAAELSRLGDKFDEIAARIDNHAEGDPAIEVDEAALYEIEQQIAAIQTAGQVYDGDEKALAGCIVAIGNGGLLQIEKGLVRSEDLAELRRLRQPEAEVADDGAAESPALPDDEDETPAAYSAVLVEELTAIRTAAMRVELVNRPELALAFALHRLVVKVFYDGPSYWRVGSAIELTGQVKNLTPSIKDPEACGSLTEWNSIHERWSYQIPGNPGDLWEWLLEQRPDHLADLLAVVVAANINGVEAKHDHSCDRLANAGQVASALKLDMRQHWEPQAPFLSRLLLNR